MFPITARARLAAGNRVLRLTRNPISYALFLLFLEWDSLLEGFYKEKERWRRNGDSESDGAREMQCQ